MNEITSSTDCAVCPLHMTLRALFVMTQKMLRWFNTDSSAYAPLLLRLLLAYEFLEAGLEKLSGENWFSDLVLSHFCIVG